MTKDFFEQLYHFMRQNLPDAAHDTAHIDRVLYLALDIAAAEQGAGHSVDYDVLLAACLLHDIGRPEQAEDESVSHALAGAEKAFAFLTAQGWPAEKAAWVADCIRTHRYRGEDEPQSLEAKILFDADKIDVAGAVGIARTLLYAGAHACPLYSQADLDTGEARPGMADTFLWEYRYKLENIYTRFYTEKGEAIARLRQGAAVAFYESLLAEVEDSRRTGEVLLQQHLQANK